MKLSLIALVVISILAIVVAVAIVISSINYSTKEKVTGQICQADVKSCPDGTVVGRTGKNCEFAPCPVKEETPIRGIYAVIGWNENPKDEIWTNQNVDGIVVRTYWKDVNPKQGIYNWGYLDKIFEKTLKYNKKIHLIIAPGFYSPDWVLKSGVETADFYVPVDDGKGEGDLLPLPLPWDEAYLNLWFGFINKVAERYKDNPSFGWISATGPNSHNGEIALPRSKEDETRWLNLVDNKELLKQKLLSAWFKTIDAYCSDFQGKHFTLALISDSFPIGKDRGFEEDYKLQLVNYGSAKCKNVFGIQTNGLDGRPIFPTDKESMRHWQYIEDYAQQTLTGFQTRSPNNFYPEGRKDTQSDVKREIFQQAIIVNGLSRNPHFLELYESAILDPDLVDIVEKAHERLISKS